MNFLWSFFAVWVFCIDDFLWLLFWVEHNRSPELCCEPDSRTPDTHLACALSNKWEEESWKAVTSVINPSGRGQGESPQGCCIGASVQQPELPSGGGRECKDGYLESRARGGFLMLWLNHSFTWLCKVLVLLDVQQELVRPVCLCMKQHCSISSWAGLCVCVPAVQQSSWDRLLWARANQHHMQLGKNQFCHQNAVNQSS